jgi:AAA domain
MQSEKVIAAFRKAGVQDEQPEPIEAGPSEPPLDRYPENADGEPDHGPMNGTTIATKQRKQNPPEIKIATLPPLTVVEWRERDLPALVLLMGEWLSTTSRALLTAATGLGKTNFGLALAMHTAAGLDFLHWKAHRAARVLYIDGEMSRRLLRDRVLAEAQRIGTDPESFFALSHQDIPGGMKALNTADGQAWINAFIRKLGGLDLVLFDNIMSLTTGDQKDSEPWLQTLPLVLSLTGRDIGQVWIHHTGHDESRSYGDKTREWQMDAVAHFDRLERDDTDISFSMKFTKARERTPANRDDFQDVKIALVNDRWEHELSRAQRPDKIQPQTARALDALRNVVASDRVTPLPGGRRAAATADWKAECVHLGLIDPEAKAHSARTLFAKYRRELVGAFRIGCEGDFSWLT